MARIPAPAPAAAPLVVKIDGGAPTGTVGNTTGSTTDFLVHTKLGTAAANFIFASENGIDHRVERRTVSGTVARGRGHVTARRLQGTRAGREWGPRTTCTRPTSTTGEVDVFDSHFKRGDAGRHAFTDSNLPEGFAPFGIQADQRRAVRQLRQAGRGQARRRRRAGQRVRRRLRAPAASSQTRLISHGDLNSPWGLVLAPASFGGFSGDLLVGNFGDGLIHAYDPVHGTEAGTLTNTDGNPIAIDGLWGLRFGNGTFGDPASLAVHRGNRGRGPRPAGRDHTRRLGRFRMDRDRRARTPGGTRPRDAAEGGP